MRWDWYLSHTIFLGAEMIIFNSDLDKTLIYSYRHEIGSKKRCVEIYEGREVSFMTEQSYERLQEIKKHVVFVPTTTRTIEQYERITLGGETPEYALVCNGGILLRKGIVDEEWYQETLAMVKDCALAFEQATKVFQEDQNRTLDIRFIKQLFIFTKSSNTAETMAKLKDEITDTTVDLFSIGEKVYVVPKILTKGLAVKRLRALLQPTCIIAAGDSDFDLSMLEEADIAFAPESLMPLMREDYKKLGIPYKDEFVSNDNVKNLKLVICDANRVFSDQFLPLISQVVNQL